MNFLFFLLINKPEKSMLLNKISLVIIALSGAAIIFYALLIRLRKEDNELPYDPQKR